MLVLSSIFTKNVHVIKIKILYYNRFNVSEGININKTYASKECIICHYWYFQDKGFKIQSRFCNGFHDVLIVY